MKFYLSIEADNPNDVRALGDALAQISERLGKPGERVVDAVAAADAAVEIVNRPAPAAAEAPAPKKRGKKTKEEAVAALAAASADITARAAAVTPPPAAEVSESDLRDAYRALVDKVGQAQAIQTTSALLQTHGVRRLSEIVPDKRPAMLADLNAVLAAAK